MLARTLRFPGRIATAIAFACGLSAGCSSLGDQIGDQIGDEGTHGCKPIHTTIVSLDHVAPVGFTGQDMIALAQGDYAASLRWAHGGTTELQLTITYDGGEIRYQDNEWTGTTLRAMARDCRDTLEVDARFDLTTSDGALAERLEVILVASTREKASWWHKPFVATSGTFDPIDHAPAGAVYDTLITELTGSVNGPGVVQGQLSGRMQTTDGDAVIYNSFDIADWNSDAEAER